MLFGVCFRVAVSYLLLKCNYWVLRVARWRFLYWLSLSDSPFNLYLLKFTKVQWYLHFARAVRFFKIFDKKPFLNLIAEIKLHQNWNLSKRYFGVSRILILFQMNNSEKSRIRFIYKLYQENTMPIKFQFRNFKCHWFVSTKVIEIFKFPWNNL